MSLLSLLHLHEKPVPGPIDELIHWDSSLSVGNAVIDAEHRQIFEALNRFYSDWAHGDQFLDIDAELERLQGTITTHFSNEEELMQRHHCPTLVEHAREHRQLNTELNALASEHHTLSKARLEARLLRFIRKLVVSHVLTWDMDARDYLHR